MKEGEIKDVNLKIYDIGEPVRVRLISSGNFILIIQTIHKNYSIDLNEFVCTHF
jgi:hypothetical protein